MTDAPSRPAFLEPGAPLAFPDPALADPQGLVAVGGDLSPARLLLAYESGLFPWFDEGYPPFWWSPDPRCVLPVRGLHVARRLRRTLRRGGYELTWNREFGRTMAECGRHRRGGTWIFAEMLEAYAALHARGAAFSLEVWWEGDLAGGIYGVQRGALFAAESMFHRRSDASKIALVACASALFAAGIELFDVQFQTPHLRTFGAVEIPRREYLARLARAVRRPVDLSAVDLAAAAIT